LPQALGPGRAKRPILNLFTLLNGCCLSRFMILVYSRVVSAQGEMTCLLESDPISVLVSTPIEGRATPKDRNLLEALLNRPGFSGGFIA